MTVGWHMRNQWLLWNLGPEGDTTQGSSKSVDCMYFREVTVSRCESPVHSLSSLCQLRVQWPNKAYGQKCYVVCYGKFHHKSLVECNCLFPSGIVNRICSKHLFHLPGIVVWPHKTLPPGLHVSVDPIMWESICTLFPVIQYRMDSRNVGKHAQKLRLPVHIGETEVNMVTL